MAKLTGEMVIGFATVRGSLGSMKAFSPTANAEIDAPDFGLGGTDDVERAASLAESAFDAYRALPLERRAKFLEAIADNILELGDELLDRAHLESGLPLARLQSERGRTVGQLRLFAEVVRTGNFQRPVIDHALPERQPLPRSDLRLMMIPVGPVAVFGASNFPLAFSVACGDTASALAAGAPVVVKAHNAHLGTSELVARAVQKAAQQQEMPDGVFSLLIGAGREIGEALVAHPAIKAVGFTGSRQGGLALLRIANARPEPIPVYAEMSSINPVFLFPGALEHRADEIARGFVTSLTMGAGQFCTNPGLVLAVDGPDVRRFEKAAVEALAKTDAQTMLTPGIFEAYCDGISGIKKLNGVDVLAEGLPSNAQFNAAQARLFAVDADKLLRNEELTAEVFGPASIVIRAKDFEELLAIAEHLEGQLTATLQIEPSDHDAARRLLPVLERKAGRILMNGFPTGVEVCHAMVHGGPFPATTSSMHSSVGASAVERFLRPVCYQDVPDDLRHEALKEGNPQHLLRKIDGRFAPT